MASSLAVPDIRVGEVNQQPVRADGEYVLYWMIAARRVRYNAALQRAVRWARELGKPLLVLEALRCDYRWASDRLHAFILDGMAAQAGRLQHSTAHYYPYVEPKKGAGKGLLRALARRACVVVTDDYPCFFLPRMVAAAGARLPVKLEQVDGNGLYPIAATDRVFTTAASFRRHLQKELLEDLGWFPRANPFAGVTLPRLRALPAQITRRWPVADAALLGPEHRGLGALPVDHDVGHEVGHDAGPAPLRGGEPAARSVLRRFIEDRLERYPDARNDPDANATSGLSPYLHFGHVSAHEVFTAVMDHAGWTPERMADRANGKRRGFWGAGAAAEEFLDQVITWRELGFNMSAKAADYDRYESLPGWARATLEAHEGDERAFVYTLRDFEQARTHDPLWNAAQRQLCREGRIHNYLRMLWGKKILEWTPHPRAAIDVLVELNNKYGLDGRDPNSYSGIFWCLGRYDRGWAERPIFGKVRYMSSDNTARKVSVDAYMARYGPEEP